MFDILKVTDLNYSSVLPELRPMLVRVANAEAQFKNDLIEQFGYSDNDAQAIFDIYSGKTKVKLEGSKRPSKIKAMKLNASAGRYDLVHGAFWEKEALDRALALAKKE